MKVLERCEICHHGKWRNEGCPCCSGAIGEELNKYSRIRKGILRRIMEEFDWLDRLWWEVNAADFKEDFRVRWDRGKDGK